MTKVLISIQVLLVAVFALARASPAEIATIGDRLLVALGIAALIGLATIVSLVCFLIKRRWAGVAIAIAAAGLLPVAWRDIRWPQVEPTEHAWNWARSFVAPRCRSGCQGVQIVSKLEWGGELLSLMCRDRLYAFTAGTPRETAKTVVASDIQIDNGTGRGDLNFRSLGGDYYSALSCDPW